MIELRKRLRALLPPSLSLLESRLRSFSPYQTEHAIARRQLGDSDPVPLSFAQERLWFLHQLQPEVALYNLAGTLRIPGSLDPETLERALCEIVRRHDALRTTFAVHRGRPVQVIAPEPSVTLIRLDLTGHQQDASRTAVEAASAPFDLASGPLLRATLLRLGPAEHVLVFVMHHIVSDGWSLDIFFHELRTLYAAYAAGQPSPLPELLVQYADFTVWQRRYLQGEVLKRHLDYWRTHLAGALPVLALPADRQRPRSPSFRGGVHAFALPRPISGALESLAQSARATLFMVLLAGFAAFLSRLSGQESILVGMPIANRNRTEIEGLIGFFVNTLALRLDISGSEGLISLVQRSREVTLSAYEHQDLPFEKLVEELRPERDLAHHPLFQVMLVLQNSPAGGLGYPAAAQGQALDGWRGTTSKFDLTLSFAEQEGSLVGLLEYSADLFERATMTRLAGHLETLLAAMAAQPAMPVAHLPLLTPGERHQILHEWNATAVGGQYGTLPELISAQAARTPDGVAVEIAGESLSYRQLERRAGHLAYRLRRRGVGPEARVGICLERSLDLAVALLGIFKAGGAYVPLEVSQGKERLTLVLADARADVIVTRKGLKDALLSALPAATPDFVLVDDAPDAVPREPDAEEVSGLLSENLAYVLYTSGSTGRPKGVGITHAALVNHMAWMLSEWPLGSTDAVLQRTSLGFDASVWELFAPLLAGARLVLAPPAAQRDPSLLVEAIACGGVTVLQVVPTLLQMLISEPLFATCRSLRRLFCGGEALTPEVRDRALDLLPVELTNLYGPTEATIDATSWRCRPEKSGGMVSIGRPISNTRVYVLDRRLQPLPIGSPGEVFLAGACLARGYFEQPAGTAASFVPDPFDIELGGRLYRTGDLGRYRTDGTVELLGRIDHQIKLRGFRIELGEIEASVGAHPAVREVAVVARDGGPGGPRLVAYVVARAGDPLPAAAELASFVAGRLPPQMVPGVFCFLEALPLTPSGKIDRLALPAPELPQRVNGYVAPRSLAETLLARVWSEVLGIAQVGVHDNFFELGGHSLLATQVVSRIREAFQVELALRSLFEAPTIEALAPLLGQIGEAAWTRILPVPRSGPLPLSFAQERLWFLDQLQPGSPLYNLASGFRLPGGVDGRALRRALNEIVRRHEVLRTTFEVVEGRPVQVVAAQLDLELAVVDLRGRGGELGERMLAAANAPFDLGRGPLLRGTLLRLGAAEHVLLVVMHHIISDGWSMGIFFRELESLYAAYAAGRESPLAELEIQYADFAVWQREHLRGELLESHLAYWREHLAGAPAVLDLPADRPRPPVASFRGGTVPVVLPEPVGRGLEGLVQAAGATQFMALLAGFQALLFRLSAQESVVVGAPIANRTRPEIEGLIGFFVNTLVLRGDLSGSPSFTELLRRSREVTLAAYERQDLPFEKLVQELAPERSLAHNPLFQVMLVLQNAPTGAEAEPAPAASPASAAAPQLETAASTAKFDLLLALAPPLPSGDLLAGVLEYAADLFDRTTALRFAGYLENLLAGLIAQPEVPVAELALLGAAERQQVIWEWMSTAETHGDVPDLAALFEIAAKRTPAAAAVELDGEVLTYRQIMFRAQTLALRLQRLGVGPEVRVGLCLDRSFNLVIAVLAVVMAKGAYVPLDPAYPRERLAFMLDDARVAVVVTESHLMQFLPTEEALQARLVQLDGGGTARRGGRRTDHRANDCMPERLAYIIYTSGSTGQPKGVAMTAGALANLLAWQLARPGFATGARTLQFASLSFDVSFQEIFSTLLSGGTLILLRDTERRDLSTVWSVIRERAVQRIFVPFVALRQLALESARAPAPSLAEVITAGEALQVSAPLREMFGTFSPPVLYNQYGPSETHVVTEWAMVQEPTSWQAMPPIGRAITGASVHVLDREFAPVPTGVPGELFLGGICLARGYLDRAAATAAAFLPNPFTDRPGSLLYRTGDVVRWRTDGAIEFLGRRDDQVKVRGYRVEPGEIEAALGKHPSVRSAAVVARSDGTDGRRLVAYVVSVSGQCAQDEELRSFLQQTLPEPLIPTSYVHLEALPLTPSGKLDRRALPAPAPAPRPLGAGALLMPRSILEERLAEIFCEVLRIVRVGVEDSFFDLGGHSLLATQVMSRVRSAFGVDLPLRSLFEGPAIVDLAIAIVLAHATRTDPAIVALALAEVEVPGAATGATRGASPAATC